MAICLIHPTFSHSGDLLSEIISSVFLNLGHIATELTKFYLKLDRMIIFDVEPGSWYFSLYF